MMGVLFAYDLLIRCEAWLLALRILVLVYLLAESLLRMLCIGVSPKFRGWRGPYLQHIAIHGGKNIQEIHWRVFPLPKWIPSTFGADYSTNILGKRNHNST